MTDMNLQFTDEEIRQQLELLGFTDVSPQQFFHFKNELQELLEEGKDNDVSDVEKLGQNEGTDAAVERVKYESRNNVLIEKLPPNSFDKTKFLSQINLINKNKENFGNNFEEFEGSETEMQAYNWRPTLFKTKLKADNVDADETSTSLSSSRQRKRKVLRKKHGKVSVEVSGGDNKSIDEETAGDDESCSAQSRLSVKSDSVSSSDVPKRWRSVSDLDITKRSIYRSKSVLLPYTNNTQAHVYYKSDPVALFHYYKREWANCNIPGEKEHKELRWNIRQALNTGFRSSSRCKAKSDN
ncbi:Hydrolethalus syndrome 1 [Chamberlinius hualienensis]